jgi:hypothetical protein
MQSWRSLPQTSRVRDCAGYSKVRDHLFTFLDHREVAADNNASERELLPRGIS